MSKANSLRSKAVTASVSGTGASTAHPPGGRHPRRPRPGEHGNGGGGVERENVGEGGGGERSTVRDRSELHHASTGSHSQANTGPRRDRRMSTSRLLYENTYRIEPQELFDVNRAEKLIVATLQELLAGRKYVAQDCKWLAQDLSSDLLARVKDDQREAGVKRYKFVAFVNIGSRSEHPDLQLSSRCLWVPTSDTFASASYSNDSLFCVATVFAVYFE